MTRPEGNVSEKAISVNRADGFGLVISKVKLVVLPTSMRVAPNTFLMTGASAFSVDLLASSSALR